MKDLSFTCKLKALTLLGATLLASLAHSGLVLAVEQSRSQASEALSAVQEELQEARHHVKKSREALEATQKDLNADEMSLVALAGLVQAQDHEIDVLRKSIRELVRKQLSYETLLADRRHTGGAALSALTLLTRVPPSAYFLDESAPHDHARMAALLRTVSPAIAEEAKELVETIRQVTTTRAEALRQRKEAELLREEQRLRMAALQRGLRLRKSKVQAAETDLQRNQRREQDLIQQSEDLRELIAAIDRDKRANETRKKAEDRRRRLARAKSETGEEEAGSPIQDGESLPDDTVTASLTSVNPALPLRRFRGGLVIPTIGEIFRNFGEETLEGQESPGLAIRTEAGRIVNAPARGEIEFAQDFRSYGGTVIIQSQEGYRLLIFGLGEISVTKGEFVQEGQQIGLAARVLEPVVYFEVWSNNVRVNPATVKIQG